MQMTAITLTQILHNYILFFLMHSHFVMSFDIYIPLRSIISLFIEYFLSMVDRCIFLLFIHESMKESISRLWCSPLMRRWIVLCRNLEIVGTMLDFSIFSRLRPKIVLMQLLSLCRGPFILCPRCRFSNLRVYPFLMLWRRIISLILVMFLSSILP